MWALKLQIAVALFVLTCGQVLFWRRRDNIFGYLAVSLFLGTLLIPLLTSPVLDEAEPGFVRLYASVLSVGAVCYLAGTAFGYFLGNRSPNKLPLTFTQPLTGGRVLTFVERRTILLGIVGVASFVAAYGLLRYAPLLAADRQSAKYGIGIYRPGFLRGATVYRFALALAAAVLPILLALFRTRRRPLLLALAGLLGLGLMLSLSRAQALAGPVAFATAWAIERRVRPALVVGGITAVFLAGAVFNAVVFSSLPDRSFWEQVGDSSPDVRDGIGFLHGFQRLGSEETHGRTIIAGLSLRPGEWDPSVYALRVRTGLRDVTQLAAGGLRLPGPLWGYSAFSMTGAAAFSLLSGLFVGWATGKWKRLLAPVRSAPNAALNLTLAVAVYEGTFGVLAGFYFVATGEILLFVVAVALGVYASLRIARPAPARLPVRLRTPAGAAS